jgi:hypothetical protein
MDEGRKRVLLIAASILAARKLAQFDGGKRVPATMSAIADAVRWAEEIMKAIESDQANGESREPYCGQDPPCDEFGL